MFAPFTAAILLLATIFAPLAAAETLIPGARLRPADPTRFHPGLVKLHEPDVRDILRLTGHSTEGDLAFRKEWLRKIRFTTPQFVSLLGASSASVQEWTMRVMGETAGDHSLAIPALIRIARDSSAPDYHRALAVRVLGRCKLDPGAVAILVSEIAGAGRELRVIVLEAIAANAGAAKLSVPDLLPYLAADDGMVQFQTFRTLREVEAASREAFSVTTVGSDYDRARALEEKIERANTNATRECVAVLNDAGSPLYVRCVAVLGLANKSLEPAALEGVLSAIGHRDEFVSQLAGNVLDTLPAINEQAIAALTAAVASTNERVRFEAVGRLRDLGPKAAPAAKALAGALGRAAVDGAPAKEVGLCLDVLRNIGQAAAASSDSLLALLEERSAIYRNTPKHEVDRLRGFIYVTMAEIGVPERALPQIMSSLANTDLTGVHEFAGAARAAGLLGPAARSAARFLIRALGEPLGDDLLAFDRFDSHANSSRQFTTCQVEALRALRAIGPADDQTVNAVRTFLSRPLLVFDGPDLAQRTPNLRNEAAMTLSALQAENPQP